MKKLIYLYLAATLAAFLAAGGCGSSSQVGNSGGTSFFPTLNL